MEKNLKGLKMKKCFELNMILMQNTNIIIGKQEKVILRLITIMRSQQSSKYKKFYLILFCYQIRIPNDNYV